MEALNQQERIQQIELRNSQGASARILNLGARLAELSIPSRKHGLINTVLGYPHPQSYLGDRVYHGAITGRFSNRIANSSFELGGRRWQLPANDGAHHLHGGPGGFSQRLWTIEEQGENRVILSLRSSDGDQGYPGEVRIVLRYELTETNCLEINWRAKSDRDTVISLSSHSYFNLAGAGDIRNHYLRIPIDHYTPCSEELIPDGSIQAVAGTAFDLREFTQMDSLLLSTDLAIETQGGLDQNWAAGLTDQAQLLAELYSPETELLLQLRSTLPGLQCYTGNHLASGGIHGTHEGVALEPQYYPDSPNQAGFPSATLRVGTTLNHTIQLQFTQARAGEVNIP